MRGIVLAVASANVLAATLAWTGVAYRPETGTITVTDFPPEKPVTLADILAADRAGSWNVIAHDPATGTYRVNASIQIGSNDGKSAFLRIGTPSNPEENLVVKGDLVVNSPRAKNYGFWEGRNGLLLGGENLAKGPTIRFDCSRAGEYALKVSPGCVLRSFGATLTAEGRDRKKGWNASVTTYPGGELVLVNTTIAFCSHPYPFETNHGVVRGCTYDDAPFALGNGAGWFEDCTFRNLETALSDGGALECTVVDCRFEGNKRNWGLAYTARGIRAVDCFFGKPQDPKVYCQRWQNPKNGLWQYPVFFAQRHVVVLVKDSSGKPVPGAKVTVTNEQEDLSAVVHGTAVTGADGKTPGVESGKALFLTDYVIRASEDPARPVEKTYTYTIAVTAEGRAETKVTGVDPDESWKEKEIVLK